MQARFWEFCSEGVGGDGVRTGGLRWGRCALGEVVVFHEHRSTRDASDRGGGCSIPPHPGGVIPHRYSARRRQPLCRQREHPNRDPAPLPRARLSGLSPITARPLEGAGGGRASGREAGVARLFAGKDVPGDMQETGAGDVPPPPPRGAILHRYSVREQATSLPST